MYSNLASGHRCNIPVRFGHSPMQTAHQLDRAPHGVVVRPDPGPETFEAVRLDQQPGAILNSRVAVGVTGGEYLAFITCHSAFELAVWRHHMPVRLQEIG